MLKHVIKQGEGLSKIALQYGFAPETIWDFAPNAQLKQLREDGNILLPGDELWIPDKTMKWESRSTGQLHRFRLKATPAKFRLQIFKNEMPRGDAHYKLLIDGQTHTGRTDADGFLEAFVPPQAERGQLLVGDDPPVNIRFSTLDPIRELVGIQKRLKNLGFYDGPCDGQDNSKMKPAISLFQSKCKLAVTGIADADTVRMLTEIHDRKAKFPEDEQTQSAGAEDASEDSEEW